ncbi:MULTISPECIES: CopD family protein [unclassified Paraburkholderia]|uniref:CopD family protein n=1 Tax=unclassified Paraburkholderia TaxID=2615204 RepID=UPI002AB683BD|nr:MULTISPECIES: CopD family protein [unclassified Paraburkholderia]
MNEGGLGILRLMSVVVQNMGFAVSVGALLCSQWLARGESTWQDLVSRRLVATLRAASIASLLASMLSFWAHCALMSDSALQDAGPAVWSMIEETGFGHAWVVGAFFTFCIVALSLLWSGEHTRYRFAIWGAVAGVALARSNGGHPVDAGLFSLPVWADWLHLLAISTWVGLVLVTTYVVMPRVLDAPASESQTSAIFVQSLSDVATYALIVLFSTGFFNGWRGINAPANLWTSTYGQVLLLKLGLVLIAATLGGHNRFFEMPKLLSMLKSPSRTPPTALLRRFGAVLHIEAVVLVGALAVAAVLAASPLPGTT